MLVTTAISHITVPLRYVYFCRVGSSTLGRIATDYGAHANTLVHDHVGGPTPGEKGRFVGSSRTTAKTVDVKTAQTSYVIAKCDNHFSA